MFSKKFYLKLLMGLLLFAFMAPPAAQADELEICNTNTTSMEQVPIYGYNFDYSQHNQIIYPESYLTNLVGARITSISFYTASSYSISFSGKEVAVRLSTTSQNSFTADSWGETTLITNIPSTATGTVTPSGSGQVLTINFADGFEYNGGNLLVDIQKESGGQYSRSYFEGVSSTGGSANSYSNYSVYKRDFLPRIKFTYEPASTDPTIKVDNDALNFNALVGGSVTSTVAVTGKNLTGDITATIAGAGFSVNHETLGTTGGELTITYAPTAAGTHTGTLTLSSAGADDVVITLSGTAEAPVTSGTVTPTSLNFNTYAGVSTTGTVTVENTGNQAFTPTFSIAAPFSIEAATEIAAGASKDFTVTYTPTAVGTDNGTLTVTINGTPTTVSLNGTANEAPKEVTVADGTDKNGYVPVYGMYYDTKDCQVQFIYPAQMLTALNGRSITGVKFFPENTIKINGGKLQLSIKETNQTVFERETAIAKPNEITDMTVVATIVPNGTDNVLEFIFDEPIPYNGGNLAFETLVVEKNSYASGLNFLGQNQTTNTAFYYYPSSGNLIKFLPKVTFAYEDGETPATPVITVDPATVDAFNTEVGTPVTATVNVTGENLTDAITATVSGTNAAYFTAVLENGVLTITYNPTEAGENHTATVTLSSTGAQDVTIALTGTATAQPYAVTVNPENGYDFGNVLVDNTKVWTITVTNNGTESVTPTLSALEAPFSTNYTAAPLAAGESATIEITFAPTVVNDNYSNVLTLSFPETTIADYTFELTGKGVNSFEPTAENEVVKLITVDKRSIYEPNFIDTANGNTTPQQLNCYDMRFKMAQPEDPAKQIKAGDLHPGNNLYEFYAIDDFGTEFRFATINLFAEGQPSSNPSVSAMDAPITVRPSVEYYTEDGMPVHPNHKHYTTLNYTEKTYNDINELVDLEGVIDYVNDTWSANTATNAHPDHYKFQIRGVGQFGDFVTSLTADYVKNHRKPDGSLDAPEGWDYGMYVGPNNEHDGTGVWQDTYYFYDLYITREFLESKGITGPVTVVINTTLSGSGYNADSYKTITVNGVEQIIAKEKFKDYSWTVPLLNEIPEDHTVAQVPMGIVIRSISSGSDFNKTKSIHIYGGTTGVSNIDTVGIYKSSMNVKAYTQKQADEDTDRNLVAMNAGAKTDVNVLAYGDPAVTGYVLNKNTSASTTGMTEVASANHEIGDGVHRYVVNSTAGDPYSASYNYVRDESLGNIDGMWLPMYPAVENEYYLPVTWANGVGDDGVVRSENNTYGSAMQQVEKNGSVGFASSQCERSNYTWVKDGVTYSYFSPQVQLDGILPAETGYELYNYRLWVDYDENAPAWDFEIDADGKTHLTNKMDRPLGESQEAEPVIGGTLPDPKIKENWVFVAPADLTKVKLVARYYYKKTSTSSLKARPTDRDRLYYVVENQVEIPVGVVTGINDVTNKTVAGVKYYNLAGMESNEPFSGVNIIVTRYTDGSISTSKVMR